MEKKYQQLDWTKRNLANFWEYESQFQKRYFAYQVGDIVFETVKKYIGNKKKALDYGSGPGNMVDLLLDFGFKTSALEFSEKSIEILKNKYGNNPGFGGAYTIEEIKQNQSKYDLILLLEVIEHLNGIELKDTMKNLKNLLAENGIAFLSTPNEEDLRESTVCCPECKKTFHRWQHVRSWKPKELESYVSGSGFKVIDVFTTNFNFEKKKSKYNLRQKIYYKLFEKRDRKYVYQPHLICVFKK